MRIALIAMSGIRAHREEIVRHGFTLPGFIERGKAIASLPSLGLLTLAGLTPDRHEVTYHEVADLRALDRLPECDLAAISTFTAQAKEAHALAARFRARGIPTVLGGLHATADSDAATQRSRAALPDGARADGDCGMPRVLRQLHGALEWSRCVPWVDARGALSAGFAVRAHAARHAPVPPAGISSNIWTGPDSPRLAA